MHFWVEPAGGEWKSANVEWKTVTLIYPYPRKRSVVNIITEAPRQKGGSVSSMFLLVPDREDVGDSVEEEVPAQPKRPRAGMASTFQRLLPLRRFQVAVL